MNRSALFVPLRARQAKDQARENYGTIEFWFRRTYGLTRTDPRFLDATVADMLEDYWMHTFYDDPKAADEIEDEDFDPEKVAELINQPLPNDFEPLT